MTSTACLSRQHTACSLFMRRHDHVCPCGCHGAWSVACRWGAHEWCGLEQCACPCSHTALVVAQKAMAA